jgi:HSP20 family protein
MVVLDPTWSRNRNSLWGEFRRLQNEMDALLSNFTPATRATFPAANLWASEEGAVVTTELPGVEQDDIEISVVGDTLTIRGKRTPAQLGEGVTYHRRERGHGSFTRSLQLPFRVEWSDVSATLKNGVLSVTLPRAQADRPRKIHVKTA